MACVSGKGGLVSVAHVGSPGWQIGDSLRRPFEEEGQPSTDSNHPPMLSLPQ